MVLREAPNVPHSLTPAGLLTSEVNFFFFYLTGNGYIEGKELENFFQELEKARKGSGMVSPHPLCHSEGFSVTLTYVTFKQAM